MNSAPGSAAAITADEWERAVASIEEAQSVCLACHVCPDGDALGSMLAFAQALRTLGKPFTASFGDVFVVPRILRFLPGLDLLTDPDAYPADPDVMVTFDAASRDRLGSLAANARKAREVIVLDHHSSNTRFGTTHLVDPAAAATAAVAEEFVARLGVPLTHDIALDLYVGLVTDTGSFKYAATTPEVHALAGRLLATGIRPEAVAREVWDRAPFGYLPVLAASLGRARLEPDVAGGLGMVWTTVTRADRAEHTLPYDLLESVIDVVRRTDEAEVAVVFKEDDEGAWQVSTRSKGRVDVGMACVALGGGGHPTAAGFTLHGEVEHAVERLRELLTQIEVATRS
ncbi:bifunctional oligoribonuclease/PAP phosphatase NrnA [Actinomadura sp. DC4]|uniref:DHH family phosphoesterase n=1 Tax=Actinomadura sp. DC4 TaxID=3055069 RepID=UPI0025B03C59|nr:bifunctional oligoribonuclease/PAP phosphatase NrnA [Actinomadura sp. DC4]MDN3356498.1 bifunctional oligoribonuclease/PAP phosphatase NrnA [Actinomadura sp. DC4]